MIKNFYFWCFVWSSYSHKNTQPDIQSARLAILSEVRRQKVWTSVKAGQSYSANTLGDCVILLDNLLYSQMCCFWEAFFFIVLTNMCIRLPSGPLHLAAGRFRSWRAVHGASVLSAPCESQCGRIRRIRGRESCSLERQRSAEPRNRLFAELCERVLTCVSPNVSLGDRCDGWRGKSKTFLEKWQQIDVLYLTTESLLQLQLCFHPTTWTFPLIYQWHSSHHTVWY